MQALKSSKAVLVKTFLYKKFDFKIGFIRIPYAILNIIFAMPISINVLLMLYRIAVELVKGGGIKDISGSFYITIGSISALCIYISYATSDELIIALVEFIENVIDRRKKKHILILIFDFFYILIK